jgi:hypothetical protein
MSLRPIYHGFFEAERISLNRCGLFIMAFLKVSGFLSIESALFHPKQMSKNRVVASMLPSKLQAPHRFLSASRVEFVLDELVNLASRAFTPSAVCDEPLIHGCATEKVKTSPDKITIQNNDKEAATGDAERGDLLIRGFWTAGADCILDVRVTDTDSKSYCKRTPFKVLESQEKEKKRK